MSKYDNRGLYVCECGEEFDNPQKFNGHKSHCIIHLGEERFEKVKKSMSNGAKKGALISKAIQSNLREKKKQQWVSEQHTCERCGKVMTEKYASGRFCCKSCASKNHTLSEEEKIRRENKRKELYNKRILKKEEIERINKIITESNLPNLEKSAYPKGYPNRKRKTYAEDFWERVLQNNSIKYIPEFKVLKNDHTPGCFKMDFYLEDYNVDLEIDGELHVYCTEKDERRDALISSRGFIVYRIPWINPKGEENIIKVKNQVDSLLEFLKNI